MKFLIVIYILLSGLSNASAKGLSARRQPNESYSSARNRSYFFKNFRFSTGNLPEDIGKTGLSAEDAKKPLNEIDIESIVDVGSFADLENEFKYIRDNRFITTEDPKFPRRITWLYPDDGCYARAETAKHELQNHHFANPNKIFVFGDLYASTQNSPTGSISWWYHVALVYRVGSEAYVFDPALEAHHPLKLKDWNKLIGGEDTTLLYSICAADSYDPSADCIHPIEEPSDYTLSIQKGFLESEWYRLIELNRNPTEELGNNPPWLNK